MTRRSNNKPVTGWKAVVLLPLMLPLAIIAGVFSTPKKRTPAEVAGYIRDFMNGTGGEWDWDDFIAAPIADPVLEEIRREARTVVLPATPSGMTKLVDLLARVETIKLEWLEAKK